MITLKLSSTKKCYRCGQDIYFDSDIKSPSGKSIPLDAVTGEPHDCPKSTFKSKFRSKKSVGEEIIDLEERERERLRKISYD